MNNFDLIPNEENLIKTLKDDLLKRNQDILSFYDLVLAQEGTTSIAVDGRWGSGKTFFVKQSMMLINAQNPSYRIEHKKKNEIINAFKIPQHAEEISENYNMAVYYDAWENDNEIDPILSIVYAIIKQTGINYNFSDDISVFKLAGSVLETFTGRNINGIIDNLKSEDPLEGIRKSKELYEKISKFFIGLLEERGNRLVVFIDELDRCNPCFAIKLLERVKHYLSDERVTFVFSINMYELQHTIKHYYGNSFDACKYLDRFFDMRISLPPVDKTDYFKKIGLCGDYLLENVSRRIIDVYNMELREVSHFYQQVKIAVYGPAHDSSKWEFIFPNEKGDKLLLIFIVPILIALRMEDITLYNDFFSGKNSMPIMDIYLNSDIGKLLCSELNADESFKEDDIYSSEQILQNLYDGIFVEEDSSNIGGYSFDSNSKRNLIKYESMLSKYANVRI